MPTPSRSLVPSLSSRPKTARTLAGVVGVAAAGLLYAFVPAHEGEVLTTYDDPVLACTPGLAGHPEQLAAAVSLAYNIGPSAYCKSTVARRFNAGDWSGACAAFEMWNQAGDKVLPGLAARRADERALCESSLPARDGGQPQGGKS